MSRYVGAATFQSLEATNSTTTYTIGPFPTPVAGNFLLLIANAGVTMTTPTGFTLVNSAVANTGLYLWSKASAAGTETSYTTTTNGTGASLGAIQYQFPAGSTIGTSATSGGTVAASAAANASVTPTAGQTVLAIAAWDYSSIASTTPVTWSAVAELYEDQEFKVPRTASNGVLLSTALLDNAPASATAPVGTPAGGTGANKQDLTCTINVAGSWREIPRPNQPARYRASGW